MALEWNSVSPLVVPELMNLFNKAQGSVPGSLNSLQSMIQGGMNSPLLQEVLGPAMQRLVQPQAQQRQQLTDMTRAAGGLRSGEYGMNTNVLLNNQSLQQNDLMSDVIGKVLQTLVSGQLQEQQNQFLPSKAYTDLLSASRPQLIGGFPPAGNSSTSSSQQGSPSMANNPFFSKSGMSNLGLSPQPEYYGSATVGPNYQPPAAQPAQQPALGGSGGLPGSNITFNPYTGMYESAPSQGSGASGNYGQLSPYSYPQGGDPSQNPGNYPFEDVFMKPQAYYEPQQQQQQQPSWNDDWNSSGWEY